MQLRGGLIKSKGACATCRIRHVKCDEIKPTCTRCQKEGRKCDGYQTFQKLASKKTPHAKAPCPNVSSALPMLPNFDDLLQRDLFAFYVSCIAETSSLAFGADFWARRVLQLSLSESSIRYALCSLSAIQRTSTVLPTDSYLSGPKLRLYALQQYNQAVKHTQALLEESSYGSEDKVIKGLVACVLFVCYENFIGNYEISHMHLQHGLQIISKECRKQSRSAIPTDIAQIFKRLDIQAMSYTNIKVPYPDKSFKEHIDVLTASPTSFASIEDSLDVILQLCRWMFRREAYSNMCPVPQQDLELAKKALERWNMAMNQYVIAPDAKTKELLPHAVVLLRMYQIIMSIIIVTGVHGQETLHDTFIHKYEEVLALAEGLFLNGRASLSSTSTNQFFCFDIGVIFPLFWVAIKLRKPRSRRRAVELLSLMRHQEGAWKSTSAAKVAQFAIGIEEEGILNDYDIPEFARVHQVNTMADGETGEIRVSCVMRSGIDGSWYTREGRIPDGPEILRA